MSGGIVRVAVAVILHRDGRVLLAQRPRGKAYEGYWEFPGGKFEPGESPRDALDRELREELGIIVRRAAPWLVRRYVYPHAHVELLFFRVQAWDGEPEGHDGQALCWQTPGAFTVAPLLPANTPILRALVLPTTYGITMAQDLGEDAFLLRARRALERGLELIQIREKPWPKSRQRDFAQAVVAIAHPHGAKVLLNGNEADARTWGCDGVHWTAAALAAASARPEDLICAASCHTRSEVEHAGRLELDFVVVAPVHPTPTHPDAIALGWTGFAALATGTTVPAFALGGLTADDLPLAMQHGAHGIALRRGAWPP